MSLEISTLGLSPTEFNGDLLVIGVYEKEKELQEEAETINKALNGMVTNLIGIEDIQGKYGEITVVYTYDKIPCKKLLVVGLGKKEELEYVRLQRISAIVVKEGEKLKAKKIGFLLCGINVNGINTEKAAQGIVEGALLGLFKFDQFKTVKEEGVKLESFVLIGKNDLDEIGRGIEIGKIMGQSQNFARNLSNCPANFLTPTDLANKAKEVAEQWDMKCTILEEEEMKKLEMNALLGVGKGSAEDSKLIIIEYTGNPQSDAVLTYVGKGVTFDTGGISIKPSQDMHEMKGDMGGAAAVLGAMKAIGQIKPKVNVTMVIGAVENMPSGTAQKPGDVVYSMSGKTIEILNTDAEGRLVLADAITYAKQKLKATHIIDVATLTGAALVALGTTTTAAITNNEEFLETFKDASKNTGERIWQLPSFSDYRDLLKSSTADIANIGGKNAGTITAGLFIGDFAEETPWIHLDIAGTATAQDNSDPINPKGETGSMVRTLTQFAIQYK